MGACISICKTDDKKENIVEDVNEKSGNIVENFVDNVEDVVEDVIDVVGDVVKEAGDIIEVSSEGFMLHDRLLRPAHVGVSSNN